MYWGAKLVGSFTDEQIEAAVSAVDLPAPAADALASMIQVRRDSTVRYWYAQVTPIENIEVEDATGGALNVGFDDFGIMAGVWNASDITYAWTFRHAALGIEVEGTSPAAQAGRQRLTIDGLDTGSGRELNVEDAVATIEIRALNSAAPKRGRKNRTTTLYLTRNPGGAGYTLSGLDH
jgi:hypothetical protein